MTNHKELVTQLRATLGKLEMALGVINDAIVWTDHAGVIQWCNKAFDIIAGAPHIQILGKNIERILPLYKNKIKIPINKNFFESILRDPSRVPREYRLKKGRPIRWLEVSIRSIPAKKENNAGIVIVIRDITERKQKEARMEQQRRTLAYQADVLKKIRNELIKSSADLKRSNKDLEQFAYAASHDLQEPLRVIASYIQLLNKRYRNRLDKDADEFIAYAVDGATRLQTLIRDLLDYSRLNTQTKPLESVNCQALMKKVLDNLKTTIEESGANITCGALPVITADQTQMARLFQNLLINAIKYRSREPLKIAISAQKIAKLWKFSIKDNGIGMDPKHLKRIFGVFVRLHTINEYPGTGIGLAICKKIIARHGGRIWAESAPGQGSSFHCTIPAILTPRRASSSLP
ncbi:MAG: PAS domain S-box protein [Elusimicrobia bacterium]|nr:PAS domain S-box protein [Elusimicrobiota bacterium]